MSITKRTRRTTAAVAALAAGLVGAVAPPAPADAAVLVSRYAFEGNTLDSAGTRNATTSNDPGYVPGVSGVGQAIWLANDGTAGKPIQVVQVNRTAENPTPFGDEFSLAMWIDPASAPSTIRTLASNTSTSNTTGNGFNLFINTTGRVRFEVNTPGQKFPVETNLATLASPDAGWIHLAVLVDRAEGLVQFYVNGNPQANRTATGITPTLPEGTARSFSLDNAAWRMGATATGSGSNLFHGGMDDARLYSGLLTAEEIGDLQVVPEPGAAAALAGLGGVTLLRRRRRRRQQ